MNTALQSLRLLLLVCLLATPVQRAWAVTVVAAIPLASASPAATLDIRTWALTKDRSRVVYVRPTASNDLWVVDLNGPSLSPRLLLQPDPATGGIISFVLTPDSQWAVVLVNMGSVLSPQHVTLVKIPLGGGAPVTVIPVDTLIAAAKFLVTSDGSRAVLSANYGGQRRFVTVSLVTGAITPLGSAMPSGMIVDYQLSANDTYLLYRTDTGASQQFSLYSQPLAGGSPSRIGPALGTNESVSVHALSPNGQWALFVTDAGHDGTFDLYSAPVAGGSFTLLGSSLQSPYAGLTADDLPQSVKVSPDSQRVLYRTAGTPPENGLYSVLINGGASVRLNPASAFVSGFWFAPDSQVALYAADVDLSTNAELYSVAVAGGSSTLLSPDPASDPAGCCVALDVSANGDVVFQMNDRHVYANAVQGGARRDLATDGSLLYTGVKIAAGGLDAYYVAQFNSTQSVIRRVALAGGTPTTVSTDFTGEFHTFELTADQRRVVYAGQVNPTVVNLFLSYSAETLSIPSLLR